MSGFVKRFLLSMVASKLQRKAHRGNPIAVGLLRQVNRRLGRHGGGHYGYGHHPYGPPRGGYHGHSRYKGHYRHKGHYRRKFW